MRLDELARRVAGADPRIALAAPDPVTVVGDEAALERALVNLVENARVHGPTGGRIAVRAAAEGDRGVLSVTDDGPGIAEGERALGQVLHGRGGAETDLDDPLDPQAPERGRGEQQVLGLDPAHR